MEIDQPKPVVLALSYCLGCGTLCLSVAMDAMFALDLRPVGAAHSGCCAEHAALVLVPVAGNRNPLVPVALPGLVGAGRGAPDLAGRASGGQGEGGGEEVAGRVPRRPADAGQPKGERRGGPSSGQLGFLIPPVSPRS